MITDTTFKSFAQMLEALPTDDACRIFLEQIRWNGNPVCPHCGSENKDHYELKTKGKFKGLRKCKDCRERFTVTVKTMFEGSHISLRKWFIAIYIFSAHKKGVSSHQLARDLGITQKSAWFVLHRLRVAFNHREFQKTIQGITELDETFVGGKDRNKHKHKKGLTEKSTVFGMMERETGKVRTEIVRNTWSETLTPIVEQNISKDSTLMTDGAKYYLSLKKAYQLHSVSHVTGEYVRENVHTNTIEGFWSLLKRGIFGIYHSVSPKHLNKYCDEFSYRYNNRKITDAERFSFSLANANERLTYKQLINK